MFEDYDEDFEVKRISSLLFLFCLLSLPACTDNTTAPTATSQPATPTVSVSQASTPATTAALTQAQVPTATTATQLPASTSTTAVSNTTAAVVTPVPATATSVSQSFRPVAKNIGSAGCCQEFSYSSDGKLVFYDKPAGDNRAGTWLLDPANAQRSYLTAGFGTFTPDRSLAALINDGAGTTTIQNLADGKTLATLNNRASQTLFSPDKKQLAWALRLAQQEGPEAPQHFELWAANLDGSNSRVVWKGTEIANLAWYPDNRRLLLTGRDASNQRFGLWIIDTTNGSANLAVDSKGLTSASLSPDGEWLAWWVTLQGSNFSGVWIGHSDGSQANKVEWLGGFRWTAGHELLYIPVRQSGDNSSALWSFNPDNNQSKQLTDPAAIPLKIVEDQWQAAPDGKTIAYRNAADNALWQLTFRP
ncbi:MAG TPA: hypothetical protein VH186_05865 [Chloroflexia bacterium]|nr:hypothetical protein [Chloroflexia bacterium]